MEREQVLERAAPEDIDPHLVRVAFFSDAVFAIAITLLVLDIRLPDGLMVGDVPAKLRDLIPQILSYALSFAVVGMYWISHHRMFRYIKRLDTPLLLLNLLFLLLVAFVPFPTRLLAAYGSSLAVTLLYPISLILTAIALYAVWRYATWKGRLVDRELSPEIVRVISLRSIGFAGMFVVSLLIAPLSVHLAQGVWLLAAIAACVLQVMPLGHVDE